MAAQRSGSVSRHPAPATGCWSRPRSGTTPGTVNVSINTSGLATGIYNGTIIVAGAGGAPGSTTISVTLNVTAPLPTITKVTNAASYATGRSHPARSSRFSPAIRRIRSVPATPVGLTLDSSGNVSTTIGGVSVTVNGFACPMIYASASQVSAVVPYQIKGFLSCYGPEQVPRPVLERRAGKRGYDDAGSVYGQLVGHRSREPS